MAISTIEPFRPRTEPSAIEIYDRRLRSMAGSEEANLGVFKAPRAFVEGCHRG